MNQNLKQLATWSKVVGVFFIIGGAVECLTIIGVIVGWLYILLGIKLLNASKEAREMNRNPIPVNSNLDRMLGEFKGFFKGLGIYIIVVASFALVVIIIFSIVLVIAALNAPSGINQF